MQVLTDNHLQRMARLASVQGADNKRNQINVGNSAYGVKGLDGELPLELSVPRQMVGEGNRLWDTASRKLSYRGSKLCAVLPACRISSCVSGDCRPPLGPYTLSTFSALLRVLIGIVI